MMAHTNQGTVYLSVAETARLVRAILRESFPGVAFSVRSESYAGGASIDVRWMDGPTESQCKEVAGVLERSYFDGMIDYAGSIFHTMDGAKTCFGADYITCHRRHSRGLVDDAVMHAMTYWRELERATWPEVMGSDEFGWRVQWMAGDDEPRIGNDWASLWIGRQVQETSPCESRPSPTLARVKVTGSDGYSRSCGSGYTYGDENK